MPLVQPKPYWQTTDHETVRLYHGNALDVLRRLPARSVQCCVTSPPYWGLRDYKTDKAVELGAEKTPQKYVDRMVTVFREVRRVLRDDGVLWLNLGDTYGDPGNGGNRNGMSGSSLEGSRTYGRGADNERNQRPRSLPPGNLTGIPWRVALAMQADGWVLRQDVIWAKPSPMPESVKNRCTKAHEYVFLFVKRMGYFYDAEAIRETNPTTFNMYNGSTTHKSGAAGDRQDGGPAAIPIVSSPNKRTVWQVDDEQALLRWLQANQPEVLKEYLAQAANKTDLWRVSSQGYDGAHFATYPPKLILPCILAGTSTHGACADCGAPWRRVTERTALTRERPNDYVKRTGAEGTGNSCANSVAGVSSKTLGWEPTCTCHGQFKKVRRPQVRVPAITMPGFSGSSKIGLGNPFDPDQVSETVQTTLTEYVSDLSLDEHPTRPCVVLDPFVGSGTTAEVCIDTGRHCWGIDLSEQYLERNAKVRIRGCLLERPAMAWLAG